MRIRQLLGAALLAAIVVTAFSAPAQTAAPAITIQRVAVPAVYTPGQNIDITVTVNKTDSRTPAALGLKDTVPGTWTLLNFSAVDPAMRPAVGRETLNADGTKNFEFAYITVPSFPAMFTYRVKTGTADAGQLNISGYALYRFTGAEEQSPVVNTPVNAMSPAEGEPAPDSGCTGCAGCSQNAKDLGVTLGDLFVSALALLTLLALSRQRG
jgi:hypothetical protein